MIEGRDTNLVHLSEILFLDSKYRHASESLVAILKNHRIEYKLIKGTKSIWCRDYMPIQVDKANYIQFRYEPSYLNSYPEIHTNPADVCATNNLKVNFSEINLDGGNVVNCKDRAIVTDRIFSENPNYSTKHQLIAELEDLLKVEIIVMPHIITDITGHADGHVRFIDRNRILGNNRAKEYKYWVKGVNDILKYHNIEYIDIPFFEHKDRKHPENALGCYVNYLEVQDLIVLPIFETNDNLDDEAIELFKQIFPDRKVETINFNDIGKEGGLLNCTTWTISQ